MKFVDRDGQRAHLLTKSAGIFNGRVQGVMRHDDQELLPTIANQGVERAEVLQNCGREMFQDNISCAMSVTIVDLLKTIQIKHDDGNLLLLA